MRGFDELDHDAAEQFMQHVARRQTKSGASIRPSTRQAYLPSHHNEPFGLDARWSAISGMPSPTGFHRHEPGVFSSIELPARDASTAAFLAGVSHTGFACYAARPQSRNSAMPTFFPAVLG
ncbi:hypothetical protein [Agrobacterium tumefaciens]|uniref:hypothetical protein n=1 Tax=Agrobacterium tumefaciens TaxID=358 RepID=UPI00131A064C|nr:hypothetical protein [Agrobacterium tumefaciens]NSY99379.1 hypothetical protein [Agrobacterium tumefaciens]